MKKKIQLLMMVLLMGTTVSLFAQDKAKMSETPEKIAQKQTEKMTKNLLLTSDQQTKVQAINLKYAQQRNATKEKVKTKGEKATKEEREQLKADLKKSVEAQEAEFKTVLTPEQYQKYLSNKENFLEKMEEKVEKKK